LLETFLADRVPTYGKDRDRPDLAGTSQLSSHLAFGEISVRAIAAELQLRAHAEPNHRVPLDKFLSELGWREFARHMLLHVPTLPDAPLRTPFERVAWRNDPQGLEAWRRGRTGFPIVDAGMRQLWETGWMHNRVRMIVGSFLVKDLLIDWREGQRWFWDTLVDADLASNAFNWQWIAGCGADAAPYFRIFNPTKQGQAWDPNGDYVRRWVPELAHLPAAQIHAPTGVKGYPAPILDHAAARKRALAAYASATAPA
jgi:deoxyribodipyrimidine photo-lyase